MERFSFVTKLLLPLFAGFYLNACTSTTPSPTQTPTPIPPTPSQTPTFIIPTIVPTGTATSPPSPTPTSDVLSGLSSVWFEDDFSSDEGWQLSQDPNGATSILNERLVIAIRTSGGFRYSLSPADPLDNFFLEVVIQPLVCQPGDEYGIMYRVNESLEHYRFTLDCDGEARVTRVMNDGAVYLIPKTDTYAAYPGPMAGNTLGVWGRGDQFRFWINGMEVFEASDTLINGGGFGLFARLDKGDQTTVSFDNFLIRTQTLLIQPTITATP
ncbi:MAG: hypothetical protein GTO18_15600 [Anaerolineales bacterium]|nr:hypothetical protein [Anaerolineales bacterium]